MDEVQAEARVCFYDVSDGYGAVVYFAVFAGYEAGASFAPGV
jgi:hypothetical protein